MLAHAVTRGDLDFDFVLGLGEFRFYRGACGRHAFGHPRVPRFVHLCERVDVGQINRCRENALLGCAAFFEQIVDLLEDLFGLAFDVSAWIRGDLAGQIQESVVGDHFRKTFANAIATNHGCSSVCRDSRKKGVG